MRVKKSFNLHFHLQTKSSSSFHGGPKPNQINLQWLSPLPPSSTSPLPLLPLTIRPRSSSYLGRLLAPPCVVGWLLSSPLYQLMELADSCSFLPSSRCLWKMVRRRELWKLVARMLGQGASCLSVTCRLASVLPTFVLCLGSVVRLKMLRCFPFSSS